MLTPLDVIHSSSTTQRRFGQLSAGIVVAFLSLFCTTKVFAKGLHEDYPQLLMWWHIDALVLAQFDETNKTSLRIEKSYDGVLKVGDQIIVADKDLSGFDISSVDPAHNRSQQFVLALQKKHFNEPNGYIIPVGPDWSTYTLGCRRIIAGKVYDWTIFQADSANSMTLLPNEGTPTLPDLEAAVVYGLSLHERLVEAKATDDPQKKLNLLTSFLVPSDDGKFTPYMVWKMTCQHLDEIDELGTVAVPFYEHLLTLPSYQSDFNPDGWIGFGAQERIQVEQRLRLHKARMENDPTRKLAILTPLFTLAEFDFRAGCDGNCLLTEIMDKALDELEKCGSMAIPFLRDVLTRPYFQATERLESGRLNTGGRERREKVEVALAKLQAHGD